MPKVWVYAEMNGGKLQSIGVRMRAQSGELCHHYSLPVGALSDDALDLHPGQRQSLGERFRFDRDVDVLCKPFE